MLIPFVTSLLILSSVSAQRESQQEAAIHLQELISYRSNSIGVLSSTYSPLTAPSNVPKELHGSSIGLPEYFAPFPSPSANGDLLLLVLPISTIYSNVLPPNVGKGMTMTVDDSFGMGNGTMAAGRIRAALFGSLETVPQHDQDRCREAYLKIHPEAKFWSGGSSSDPHYSYFARFRVTSVYYFGGFGNVSWIGWIPLELFHAAYAQRRSRQVVEQHWPNPGRGLGIGGQEEMWSEGIVQKERFRIQI